MRLEITPADPRSPDIVALLERHLGFTRSVTPPEHVFALDLDGLCRPEITMLAAREDGELLGIGALKRLDVHHGELKSMHTAAEARGRGIAAAIVERLEALAVEEGLHRLSLETGSQPAFEPARQLYRRHGFEPCGPFADYPDSEWSCFMTKRLTPPPSPA